MRERERERVKKDGAKNEVQPVSKECSRELGTKQKVKDAIKTGREKWNESRRVMMDKKKLSVYVYNWNEGTNMIKCVGSKKVTNE